MLRPIGSKGNAAIEPVALEGRRYEGLEDNFEAIFSLLNRALAYIRENRLRSIPELEVDAVQNEYQSIACEIGSLRSAKKIDGTRWNWLTERFRDLVANPLGASSDQALWSRYSELCAIYTDLRDLYKAELFKMPKQEDVDFSIDPLSNNFSSFLSIANKKMSSLPEPAERKSNFLGLLAKDQVQRELMRDLSPELCTLLNDKMREVFYERIEWMKQAFNNAGDAPKCFICFNSDEQDVIDWLREVLIPDLRKIGVTPICSLENLPPGDKRKEFQKRAVSEDFAIVICTPALYDKFLMDKDSGVAEEIDEMQKRFVEKKGTTIPILFKRENGKKTNHVNPFQNRPEEPFGVSATLDNYSGILEFFAVLLRSGSRDECRKIAKDCINTIRFKGTAILQEMLEMEEKKVRSVYEASLFVVKSRFSKSPIQACTLFDGRSMTNQWIQGRFFKDFQRLNLANVSYSSHDFKSADLGEGVISSCKRAKFIFLAKTDVLTKTATLLVGLADQLFAKRKGELSFFQLLLLGFWDKIDSSIVKCSFNLELFAKSYCESALKIWTFVFGNEVAAIHDATLKKREAEIKALSNAWTSQKRDRSISEQDKEAVFKYINTYLSRMWPRKWPERDHQCGIPQTTGKFVWCHKDLPQAKDAIASAIVQSRQNHRGHPNHPTILFALKLEAQVNFELGFFDDAIKSYRQIIGLDNGSFIAHRNLGRIYGILGNFNESRDCFAKALKLSEADMSLRVEYGNLLLRCKKYQEAIDYLKEVIASASDDSFLAYGYVDFPALYEELGKGVESWGKLNLPAQHVAYFLLGKAFIAANQIPAAQSLCTQFNDAIQIRPSTESYSLLGFLHWNLKEKGKARDAFHSALLLNQGNQIAREYMERSS